MFIVRCDRCGNEAPEIEVTPLNVTEGPVRISSEPAWLYPTPRGWNRVLGQMLCTGCVASVGQFLKESPIVRRKL